MVAVRRDKAVHNWWECRGKPRFEVKSLHRFTWRGDGPFDGSPALASGMRQSRADEKSRCKQRLWLSARGNQAVSPYTETLTSTTTSVCRDTLTEVSPTTLMGPWGMRTWALERL